jgi:hypothetical protein
LRLPRRGFGFILPWGSVDRTSVLGWPAGVVSLPEQVLRLFVSSPGDVPDERRRVDLVVERLNTEFEGRVRIEAIRWETSYYAAHETFQKQIPEAADCDVVVAVFRARLGTPLPAGFRRLPSGDPFPSGTAYEVLSAIEVRKAGKGLPDEARKWALARMAPRKYGKR